MLGFVAGFAYAVITHRIASGQSRNWLKTKNPDFVRT
jgi:hypothetical protein